ncbi:MAG: GTPase HflX [Bdellovibrionaceae bacterium]|nr:GTPase HflX [Pseudobdellovibrionaceae bacterium]
MNTTENSSPANSQKIRAIVVGVGLKSDPLTEIKESLLELEDLTSAWGAEVVGSSVQVLPQFQAATLMGSGKVQEITEMIQETEANVIIVDHSLSGVQGRNLEKSFGVRVMDRNQVIVDIFALRAKTYEGKLQVELAQMLDQLPRMVGAWMGSLSRQGGGIGAKGPGETALENDRRRIRERVKAIRKKLEGVRKQRKQHRSLRRRQQIPTFAMIGYTNSGKSSLLNQMTGSQVMAKNQMFATLDPTTRKVYLPEAGPAVVTDTVGFIRKLPPHLIEAFKATLEESEDADILLHVIDLSSPSMDQQVRVVDDLIQEFGWDKKPVIYVFNKIDVAPFEKQFQVKAFPRVFVSALTGEGLDKLRKQMTVALQSINEKVQLYFPKEEEYKIYELSRESQILKSEPASTGTVLEAQLTPEQLSRWGAYLLKK